MESFGLYLEYLDEHESRDLYLENLGGDVAEQGVT